MTGGILVRRSALIVALSICVCAASSAAAQQRGHAPSNRVVAQIAACQKIATDSERLACYDREVAAFSTAVEEKKVAVVEREDVRKTRRSLFGIALPKIAIFDDADEPEPKAVTATIKSVARGAEGKLVFTLEDGAVWTQTDNFPVGSAVKAGQKVTLKRASFGTYFADFEKAASVRAKRLR